MSFLAVAYIQQFNGSASVASEASSRDEKEDPQKTFSHEQEEVHLPCVVLSLDLIIQNFSSPIHSTSSASCESRTILKREEEQGL
jgi:hypothetical protein